MRTFLARERFFEWELGDGAAGGDALGCNFDVGAVFVVVVSGGTVCIGATGVVVGLGGAGVGAGFGWEPGGCVG